MPNLNNPFLTQDPYSPNWQFAPLNGSLSVANDDYTNNPNPLTAQMTNYPLSWITPANMYYDLRYIYVQYESSSARYFPYFAEWNFTNSDSICRYMYQSDKLLRDYPGITTTACFKPACLKYAQTSYFVAVVMVQWSNVFSCKRKA